MITTFCIMIISILFLVVAHVLKAIEASFSVLIFPGIVLTIVCVLLFVATAIIYIVREIKGR